MLDWIKSKAKMLFSKAKVLFIQYYKYLLMMLPFLFLDVVTRVFGYKVDFFPFYYPVPNLFTVLWAFLFVFVAFSFKKIIGSAIYWIFFVFAFVLYLTNNIYYGLTQFYFTSNLLQLTDEGSAYILDTILETNPLVYIIGLAIIVFTVVIFKKFRPEVEKFNVKQLFVTVVAFLIIHTLLPFCLGSANSALKWNTFKQPRNVYEDFSDCNKSMKVAGLYEYTVRDFYVTYLKAKEKMSDSEKAFLDNIYNSEDTHASNDYTGMFKGKNIIFLQLEGIDDWLLTEEHTPNLYALKEQSIDFTNHYSIYTGGGSTFNSEFAVNTGFTTPVSYIENVYTFNKNYFPYSMPRMFESQGYKANIFHMNSGDFYSRRVNYNSWGYENYWGLCEVTDYKNHDEYLDRELILNDVFYDKMFVSVEKPFITYLITYTLHKPFNANKDAAKKVAEVKYGEGNIPKMSEEECIYMQVEETDYMIGLLMKALKDTGLYDDTVIITFTDHYLYTIADKTILDNHKDTYENVINHTPFFIWSADVKPEKIEKTNMQIDILPTVLNLFGIDYNSNYYLGYDIFSNQTKGYAFFNDYSWYDSNIYVKDGKVTRGETDDSDYVNTINKNIGDIIKKNDLTLKYDYFRTVNTEE